MESEHLDTDWSVWKGHQVVDSGGAKVGIVEEIYLDNETGRPEWLAIKTGLFGHSHSLAPLAGAVRQDGVIGLSHQKDVIAGAPRAHRDDGVLTPEEEAHLYEYYGYRSSDQPSDALPASVAVETRLRPYDAPLSTDPPNRAEPVQANPVQANPAPANPANPANPRQVHSEEMKVNHG
ncbi:MAG: hypothetical protein NVS3B12_00020 [Acidimicrobiales bacterium]